MLFLKHLKGCRRLCSTLSIRVDSTTQRRRQYRRPRMHILSFSTPIHSNSSLIYIATLYAAPNNDVKILQAQNAQVQLFLSNTSNSSDLQKSHSVPKACNPAARHPCIISSFPCILLVI